jgi:hypothetical protein
MADLDDVIARLESVAEELADLALESLRAAVDRGETGRPADERALTRARAAVERAVGILQDV